LDTPANFDVRVQSDPFLPGAELDAFTASCATSGAVVSFTGIVRDVEDGLVEMQIEHYPGMTEKALSNIAQDAHMRWALQRVLIIHRHGLLQKGETIMMVATASKHRADAFASADFLMDYLKSRAPFWKKERSSQGAEWVDATKSDEDALKRW
jgi:molybdopterin synthase catalytic subunit